MVRVLLLNAALTLHAATTMTFALPVIMRQLLMARVLEHADVICVACILTIVLGLLFS